MLKPWVKILFWGILSGSVGTFTGFRIGVMRGYGEGMKDGAETQLPYPERERLEKKIEELQEENRLLRILTEAEDAEETRKEYEGRTGDTYSAAEEEDAEMPDPPPEIDGVKESGVLEWIGEEDYYQASGGLPQETLLFYTEDETVFNKDTRTKLSNDEILKSLRCVDGAGVKRTFFWPDRNGDTPETVYLRNHMIGVDFRVDRIDAAFAEDRGDETEDGDDDG